MSHWVEQKPLGMPEGAYYKALRQRAGRRYWEKHSRTWFWRFWAFGRGY